MNEQDIIKRIENETKDLPIPDSISPSNMEKMLNEHIENNTSNADTSGNSKKADPDFLKNSSKVTRFPAGKKIGLALAACFGVIILGSGAFGVIKHNMYKTQEYTADAAMDSAVYDESENYEKAEEESCEAEETYSEALENSDINADAAMSDEDIEADENKQLENDLVASGVLDKPSSYDDYYDTLANAFQKKQALLEKDKQIYRGTGIEEDIEYSAAESEDSTFTVGANADSNSISSVKEVVQSDSSSDDSKTSGSKDYSTTNTQEKTVDEGDIVKTDGDYIYTANTHGYNYYSYDINPPTISITKADNGKLEKMSTITLDVEKTSENVDYNLLEFYIYNNYLIVMLQKNTQKEGDVYGDGDLKYNEYNYNRWYYNNQSVIKIYDISNKRKPKNIKTLYQSGNYESSRISDGYLYTISHFVPESRAFTNNEKGRTVYSDYIPYINDDMIAYDDIYYTRHLESMGTYVVTSLDLSSPYAFTNSKAVSSSGGEIYVGEKAIYLYGTIYSEIQKTEILKISYDKGKLYIGNRAMIAGYLYGSFALSEYNDHLRIVSTIPANNFSWFDNRVWTNSSKDGSSFKINEDINAVYVLDNNMKLTGRITGLAPGEQIYSARFFKNIGYFVTYRNTDPLFSVDFSDPKEPKILGQLKIPGFSNYLHFYGNDTLLGIGEERDPYTQDFKGLKLSMFDISDPTNVTEEDKFIIKNSYYSSAQYDHKSIMIDPDKNVFGFCYEYEDYDEYGDYNYNYYYATYTYDAKKGFIETARYKIDYDYMYDLENIRGLYIGNYFYLVTPQSIESYKLGSEEQIDRLYLD